MNTDSALLGQCHAYFENFLPTLTGQLLIEDLRSLSCRFGIRVKDGEAPSWTLEVEEGRLTRVNPTDLPPECCFACDARTLLDVVSARLSPQEAFFAMRVEVEGDMELGLKLSTVLAPFFSRYPFTP